MEATNSARLPGYVQAAWQYMSTFDVEGPNQSPV